MRAPATRKQKKTHGVLQRRRRREPASACQSGQAALATGLLNRFASATATGGGNLVFSPLSIHVALALMSAGAAEDTLDEILSIAGAPSRGDLEAFVKGVVVERILADRSGVGGPSVAFATSRATRGPTRGCRSSPRTATPSSAPTRARRGPSISGIMYLYTSLILCF